MLTKILVLIFFLLLHKQKHTIMKTAKQLREIVVKNKGISMSAIEYHCTRAAENGATSVMIFDREISARDLFTLEYKGIKVDRFNDAEGFHWELSWHI